MPWCYGNKGFTVYKKKHAASNIAMSSNVYLAVGEPFIAFLLSFTLSSMMKTMDIDTLHECTKDTYVQYMYYNGIRFVFCLPNSAS